MKLKLIFIFLISVILSQNLFAQKNYTGDEAADYVQEQRELANALIEKNSPTATEINKGINILKKSLLFLDSLPIKELALNNAYLWYRRSDANRDLAKGYALLGQKDSTLAALNRMAAVGPSSGIAQFIQQDSAFNTIKNEPGYLSIIQKLNNRGALWKNTAFKTNFRSDLPVAEKIAGLSLLWAQAKYNFVNFDLVNIDWNKAYLDYLPLVQNTGSTAEYYKVLIKFYAQLNDGHTNVYVPDALSSEFYTRPPFRTELVEGHVFCKSGF